MTIQLHTAFRLILFLALLPGGCTAAPLMDFELDSPAMTLSAIGMAPVRDGRARFREIFCAVLAEESREAHSACACDAHLWCLGDEKSSPLQVGTLPCPDFGLKILIVPGFLGECAWDIVKPFETAVENLRHLGYDVDWVLVSGRSSSDHNAAQIAQAVASIRLHGGEGLVLLGHSKGAVDILHFLVEFPDQARKVKAVVSVAGAINGSPMADSIADSYNRWFSSLSVRQCPVGDKGALQSLKRPLRLSWLAEHPLPKGIQYFSIGAFTNRSHVSSILRIGYDELAPVDPRNDGLLIFYDQLIPGSVLLGYAAADHLSVVYPLNLNSFTDLTGDSRQESYPRKALLRATLLYVSEMLQNESP